ncbi:MAG: RecQ family ATP-dependent DNA helicase, partial [Synergistaceae bacterium]|nr:RecQ family ATP-dependent DNA helicase [Synergistaceae bacterium]
IKNLLNLKEPLCITTGFDRPNLRFEVVKLLPREKTSNLIDFINLKHKDHSGIVYCSTRKTVETVCEKLCDKGLNATRYHAGLELDERRINQENFINNKVKIIVATNAFGMGIDKPDVRFVVHYNMPKEIESYYQEAGRAGRDGKNSDCLLMYDMSDIMTAKHFIDHNYKNSLENEMLTDEQREFIKRRDLWRLAQIENYCKSKGCLRAYLLRYFGETPPNRCDNCSTCDKVNAFKAALNSKLEKSKSKTSRADNYKKYEKLEERNKIIVKDITLEAQKILSAVRRVELKFGSGLGIGAIIRLLTGSQDESVYNLGLDQIKTYGAMRGTPASQIGGYIAYLIDKGYLYLTANKYSRLCTVDEKREAVFNGEQVFMEVKAKAQAQARDKQSDYRSTRQPLKIFKLDDKTHSNELFKALRELRLKIAHDEEIAAFRIFYDSALHEMSEQRPRTMSELMSLEHVRKSQAKQYGKIFLDEIAKWR